jgi:hypothetical protein
MNVIDFNNLEHDGVRKPPRTFRHQAWASRPDMMLSAGVAELVDALDLGSSDESRGGSSPSARTKRRRRLRMTNSGRTYSEQDMDPPKPPALGITPRADQIDSVPALTPDQAGRRLTPCR